MKDGKMEILHKEWMGNGYGEVFKRNDGKHIIQFTNNLGDKIQCNIDADGRTKREAVQVFLRLRNNNRIGEGCTGDVFLENLLDKCGFIQIDHYETDNGDENV